MIQPVNASAKPYVNGYCSVDNTQKTCTCLLVEVSLPNKLWNWTEITTHLSKYLLTDRFPYVSGLYQITSETKNAICHPFV